MNALSLITNGFVFPVVFGGLGSRPGGGVIIKEVEKELQLPKIEIHRVNSEIKVKKNRHVHINVSKVDK